jgi:CBS domain-containing protein
MTGDYKIILPLMIATTISSLLATKLQTGSIYTLKLMRRGIDLRQGVEFNVLKSLRVKDVMRNSIEIIPANTRLKEMTRTFMSSQHTYLYITSESGEIREKISQTELSAITTDYETLKDIVVAQDIATPNLLVVRETDPLDCVMQEFGRENVGEIPVVSSQDPRKILGTVWRVDVIAAYNKELLKRDLTGQISSMMATSLKIKPIEVMDGLYLHEIVAPSFFIGKKIKDIDVRNRFGVDIMLIKRHAAGKRQETQHPTADYIFQSEDSLLILGEKDRVVKLSKL